MAEPRLLGSYLMEMRFISREQLRYGLQIAAIMAVSGNRQPIGKTLIELGFIREDQLDIALKKQSEEIRIYELRKKQQERTERVSATKEALPNPYAKQGGYKILPKLGDRKSVEAWAVDPDKHVPAKQEPAA